jgi:hypothetical protein
VGELEFLLRLWRQDPLGPQHVIPFYFESIL